jgi:hypothetical protein
MYLFILEHPQIFNLKVDFFKELIFKIEEDYSKFLETINGTWIAPDLKYSIFL